MHQTVETWPRYHYAADLLRVVDGDTIRVRLALGCHVSREMSLRLAGIDAPELFRGEDAERERGAIAKEALQRILGIHRLYVETIRDTQSFDRFIAHVFIPDADGGLVNVADLLVDGGYAERSDR